MREITKTVSVRVDGKPRDFRLTKLDAFSGVSLLRMLVSIPAKQPKSPERTEEKNSAQCVISTKAEGCVEKSPNVSVLSFFTTLSDTSLRSLMTTCLQHAEVLLPAGWMPVMTRGEWSYPELEHDTAVCLRLTIEEVLWTLEGFFGGGGSTSRSETPGS